MPDKEQRKINNEHTYTVQVHNFNKNHFAPKNCCREDIIDCIGAIIGRTVSHPLRCKFYDPMVIQPGCNIDDIGECEDSVNIKAFVKDIGINHSLSQHEVIIRYDVSYTVDVIDKAVTPLFVYWNTSTDELILGCKNSLDTFNSSDTLSELTSLLCRVRYRISETVGKNRRKAAMKVYREQSARRIMKVLQQYLTSLKDAVVSAVTFAITAFKNLNEIQKSVFKASAAAMAIIMIFCMCIKNLPTPDASKYSAEHTEDTQLTSDIQCSKNTQLISDAQCTRNIPQHINITQHGNGTQHIYIDGAQRASVPRTGNGTQHTRDKRDWSSKCFH